MFLIGSLALLDLYPSSKPLLPVALWLSELAVYPRKLSGSPSKLSYKKTMPQPPIKTLTKFINLQI
jgi:hypothetical protein